MSATESGTKTLARGITKEQLDHWFSYHPPDAEKNAAYTRIREAGRLLAEVIVNNTPPSADQTAALRKVREACFTANAALACDGR